MKLDKLLKIIKKDLLNCTRIYNLDLKDVTDVEIIDCQSWNNQPEYTFDVIFNSEEEKHVFRCEVAYDLFPLFPWLRLVHRKQVKPIKERDR